MSAEARRARRARTRAARLRLLSRAAARVMRARGLRDVVLSARLLRGPPAVACWTVCASGRLSLPCLLPRNRLSQCLGAPTFSDDKRLPQRTSG